MSLVSKLKNILFEEEEIEIPVIEKKENKTSNVADTDGAKRAEIKKSTSFDNIDVLDEDLRPASTKKEESVSEREIFKSEKTFNFPAFDEEEFENLTPKIRSTNILEHEKRKNEKRQDYKTPLKKEVTVEKTKFKPSPIISPVYGILDKNYTPDEITSRSESTSSRTLDVDSVRRKAFGSLEENKKQENIVREEIEDKIFEEKMEKARTIDELLNDSSDEIIDVEAPASEDIDKTFSDIEPLENIENKKESVTDTEDDTLESDLFDLIDSMYENREDGE